MKRSGQRSISFDIADKKLSRLGPKREQSIAVCFAQYGEGSFFGIEIGEIQPCGFTCPGAGVVQKVQNRKVAEAVLSFQVDRGEDLEHVIMA